MDWQLFYQSGVVVTAVIAIFTLWRVEDMTEREKIELGVILFFGLLVWPIVLYGLVAINNQMNDFRLDD